MNVQVLGGVSLDVCARCAGVFYDADETADLKPLDGHELGPSERSCPAHRQPMTSVRLEGGIEIDKASCCGGVFLDAGEISEMTAIGPDEERCPECQQVLSEGRIHGVSVHVCEPCASFFYERGEAADAAIDTEALFATAPWGAPVGGMGGPCPQCQVPMVNYRPELMGQAFDVAFARCCGGVWVAKQRDALLRGAARRAVMMRADIQFATGDTVQTSRALRTTASEDEAAQEASRVHDRAMQRIDHAVLLQAVKKSQRDYRDRSSVFDLDARRRDFFF